MKKVALQFPSIIELVDFTLTFDDNQIPTKSMTLLLICEVSDKEIELAKKKFKAHVVDLEVGDDF
jgi:hypothetical protein